MSDQQQVKTQHALITKINITVTPTLTHNLFTHTHAFYGHTDQLVSWSLTSHFITNMAISETKGQAWRAIPTQ